MRGSHLIAVLFCSFLFGCAIVIAPSGGGKDLIPPQVLSSSPANYSTNFVGKEIEIEFDEFIKLKDLYNNFIVSPPLDEKPEVLIRGKSVVMKLDEPLPPNSTFNFNFGEAIVDIHENNPIKDFHFVVSTGAYVDSFGVQGIVTVATTLLPAEDVWVMLYDCLKYAECDSLPSKQLPKYLTKTNKSGGFKIDNIQEGSYKVFALDDQNRNYLFDLPNESIGFIGTPVQAEDSVALKLTLFDQEDDNQKITKIVNVEQGFTKIAFKLPVDDVQITALDFSSKTRWEAIDYSPNRDTVNYWNTSGMDSLKLHIIDKRYAFDDTITIGTGKKKKVSKLKVTTSVDKTKLLDIGKELQLRPSKPLTMFDEKAIKIVEHIDSVTTREVAFKLTFADEARRVLNVEHDWKPETSYSLKLEKGALTDFFQGKSDTVSVDFALRKEEYYGNAAIEIALKKVEHTYIIQLLNAAGKVVKEDFILPSESLPDGKKKLVYKHIIPGKHRLKVIYDVNNNRRWDTGDHAANHQPERIGFAKEKILIRSNWDLVLDWVLD